MLALVESECKANAALVEERSRQAHPEDTGHLPALRYLYSRPHPGLTPAVRTMSPTF